MNLKIGAQHLSKILLILLLSLLVIGEAGNLSSVSVLAGCSNSQQAQALLGVYYGNQGFNIPQLQAMEAWQSKKDAVVTLFTDWEPNNQSQLFQTQLPAIWDSGHIPLVTWEPFIAPGTAPANIETRIATGQYDSYIQSWMAALKSFVSGADNQYDTPDDKKIYLRLGHEMNGNYYPWSASQGVNTPADYINMWIRAHNIAGSLNLDSSHVQWVWSVNSLDIGNFTAEQYYPGDNYTDWLGIDGYNFGNTVSGSVWQNPPAVFDNMIQRLRAISPTKPLGINEIGSTTQPNGINAKNQWTIDVYNYLIGKKISMISWFNEDKETDWAVFGGSNGNSTSNSTKVYSGYLQSVSSPNIVGGNSTNLKIITDSQFKGYLCSDNIPLDSVKNTNAPTTTNASSTATIPITTQVLPNLIFSDIESAQDTKPLGDQENILELMLPTLGKSNPGLLASENSTSQSSDTTTKNSSVTSDFGLSNTIKIIIGVLLAMFLIIFLFFLIRRRRRTML